MDASGPLAGIRVVDFGHVWAGPYCTATLADLGAEVIKVESTHRLDVHRRQGPYQEGAPEYDRSGVWNAQNRGKRSVALNLRTPQGRAVARRLLDASDVTVENFSPGVMDRLELSYPVVSESNRGLVYASLSAFGQQGPFRSGVGYGPSLDAWSGLDSMTRYPGGQPGSLGGVFPDTGSALYAAVAIIAALIERDVTGVGRYIDLSELEVSALLIGEEVFARSKRPRGGDDGPEPESSLCVRTSDEAWVYVGGPEYPLRRLAGALALPEWEAWDSTTARGAIHAWARQRTAPEVVAACVAAGVPVGKVYDVSEVLADAQLKARGFFDTSMNPRIEGLPVYGPIAKTSHGGTELAAAPELGEANDYVLFEILGLSIDEVNSLRAANVLE